MTSRPIRAARVRRAERRAIARWLRSLAENGFAYEFFGEAEQARSLRKAACLWAKAIEMGAHGR